MKFVVLHHTGWPGHCDHYDLMLQVEARQSDDDRVLKTFSTQADVFPVPPVLLKKNVDHRRAYLKFEGEASDGRGRVERVDAGEFHFLDAPDAIWQNVRLELFGNRLKGRFLLRCTGADEFSFEQLA
jgi:hypothetical protein